MRRLAALPLLLILLAPPTAALAGETLPPDGRPRLEKTHPGQAGSPPFDPEPKPAIAAPRPPFERQERIVYAFDRPALSLLTRDAELSALCRQGRFNQRIDGHYRAFGPGERPLGVAYGRMAVNLVDPGGRRDADTVYFFDKQDTGRCAVFTGRAEDLREWFVPP